MLSYNMRDFDQAIADDICERISNGQRIRQVCLELKTSSETVYDWIHNVESFAKQYARAKEHQAEVFSEEIMDLCDSIEFKAEYGNAAVQAVRVQIDTRKWLLSKLLPRKYGDRIEQRIADPEGNALKIVVTGIRPTDDNTA